MRIIISSWQVTAAQTEQKQAAIKIKHLASELTSKKKEMKSADSELNKMRKECNALQQEANKFRVVLVNTFKPWHIEGSDGPDTL